VRRAHGAGAIHELPAVRVASPNGYRWPLGTRALTALVRDLRPDAAAARPVLGAARRRRRGARPPGAS
jgi:hypothetical protein